MKVGSLEKQPSEIRTISIMYDEALDVDDEISVIDSYSVEPIGLDVTPVLVDVRRVRLFIGGGSDGVKYKVTVIVTTNGGERHEDEVIVKVKEI